MSVWFFTVVIFATSKPKFEFRYEFDDLRICRETRSRMEEDLAQRIRERWNFVFYITDCEPGVTL